MKCTITRRDDLNPSQTLESLKQLWYSPHASDVVRESIVSGLSSAKDTDVFTLNYMRHTGQGILGAEAFAA